MSFNPVDLWNTMTPLAKGVAVLLILMSIYSLTVAIERWIYFAKAKKQSLAFAKLVTLHLKQDKLQEAIESSKKYKQSHLARVVSAGLYEFQHDLQSGTADVVGHDPIEAAERAIEREALMTTADMRKGLSGLATIGTTSPFIGLFGTVIGIINAFRGMAMTGSGGIAAVSTGIAEALITTALGLFVAIPAVWLFNIFTNKIERFQVEMSNSASELIDYFIKRRGAGVNLSARAS
ncbi:MAG TPA: MotA/TolQ/ExbB proton channel family protein [Thermoanaerobaculia bacterium]|jgi:biopolymer transport protein ExbB/biopolymer transport protein TolQ|nr:MotA/TolQ/ExbB proton channel family protein [Thermoanaerobaculia bacterium]HLN92460.1 MotA/TolQ/ExbB proton channel family protein [Thermoanaerobaculia bacterium]HLP24166.1 MotA/TolQ/ExbB proton channel family protein [Acidobacteriota bacterium]